MSLLVPGLGMTLGLSSSLRFPWAWLYGSACHDTGIRYWVFWLPLDLASLASAGFPALVLPSTFSPANGATDITLCFRRSGSPCPALLTMVHLISQRNLSPDLPGMLPDSRSIISLIKLSW